MADGGRREQVARLVAAHGLDLAQLCDACVTALPAVDGAGLTVMTSGPGQHVRYTSDAVSARLEELQLTLGEGPGKDAYAEGRQVFATDLDDATWQQRWPMFSRDARGAGAAAVFALPLQVGAVRLGVIDLYRAGPGALVGEDLAQALAFADAATELLLAEQMPGAEVAGSEQWCTRRAVVHQATGMVGAQMRIPMAQAFLRLRARAYACEVGLDDIAREVVARRLRFTAGDSDDDTGSDQ